MLSKPPPDWLELRGEHVEVYTNGGVVSGILRGIDNTWLTMEKVSYHITNNGVRKHQTFETIEGITSTMVPVIEIRMIQKIYNVEITC